MCVAQSMDSSHSWKIWQTSTATRSSTVRREVSVLSSTLGERSLSLRESLVRRTEWRIRPFPASLASIVERWAAPMHMTLQTHSVLCAKSGPIMWLAPAFTNMRSNPLLNMERRSSRSGKGKVQQFKTCKCDLIWFDVIWLDWFCFVFSVCDVLICIVFVCWFQLFCTVYQPA